MLNRVKHHKLQREMYWVEHKILSKLKVISHKEAA